jgi:hypothetical protein
MDNSINNSNNNSINNNIDNSNDYKVLFHKSGILLEKKKKNNYQLSMEMENKSLHLLSIVDFDLLKLLYDLNQDIYEKIIFEKLNENEVIATLLMKHFFVDLGLPQRYSYLHIEKKIAEEKNGIEFYSTPICAVIPEVIPDSAVFVPLEKMITKCEMMNDVTLKITCFISFQENHSFPLFIEKFVGQMIFKIFNRLKQFIEKFRI